MNIRRVAGLDDLSIKIESAGGSFEEIAQTLMHEFRTRYSIRVGIEQRHDRQLASV